MTQHWQPGQPVATGELYFKDRATREAYGDECQRQLVDSWARFVLRGSTLADRRGRIEQCPHKLKFRIKNRVTELWRRRPQ